MATNGTAAPQVIFWDYQFAPNAQKSRNYVHAAGIPYKHCDQPFVLPRPILANLGVTYRRIPVISIGKDLYCDNRVAIDAFQKVFKNNALVKSPADGAYEAFGYRSFWIALPLVPADLITDGLSSDRKDLFAVFSRPDFRELRPNSLAEMKQLLDIVETEFLGSTSGTWINGDKCGIADIHAMWIIKWCFQTLDLAKEPGFSKDDFPRVYKWIEAVPPHDEAHNGDKLDADAATALLKSQPYAVDVEVVPGDPTGLKGGEHVAVETTDDAKPSSNPQQGTLVGLTRREIVVELPNSLRVHFPRVGYTVKKA